MTEAEWLVGTSPGAMLSFLFETARELPGLPCACCRNQCERRAGPCPTYRRLRLIACACARRVLPLLEGPSAERAIEAAERYVDGRLSELASVNAADDFDTVRRARFPKVARSPDDDAWNAVYCAVHRRWWAYLDHSFAHHRWQLLARVAEDAARAGASPEGQCAVIRDVFGNPFRPAVPCRGWLTATVAGLARAAYEERALPEGELDGDRLAVLADALEEAGCEDGEALGHLRAPGPHVRGCWVIDLLLGQA